jgi:X-Pro dipeptidyl-peptidase
MRNCFKKRLTVFLLVAVTAVFFAATAFGAGNAYLRNNLLAFPNLVSDGKTQPVIPMNAASWVNEEVWVEAPLDFDEDGKRDLLCFVYGRPISSKEFTPNSSGIVTAPLLVCPMIIRASPYAGGSVGSQYYSQYDYQYMEPKVDGPWPGENNPSTMHYTYDDVKSTRKLYKDIVDANFKPDWLPSERATWIIERDGASRGSTAPPGVSAWHTYFRPRGYAYGTYYSLGNRAEGFCMANNYEEAISTAAVVDWLNGRVKAYRYPYPVRLATQDELDNNPRLSATTPNLSQNTEGRHILDDKYIRDDVNGGYVEVKAYWATGDACMTGQSYDAALPLMGFMTGVDGLKVIVPFASISSTYDYYRANGMVYAPGGYQGEDITMYLPYCGGRIYLPTDPTNPIRMGNNNPDVLSAYYRKTAETIVAVDRETGNYNATYDDRNLVKKEYIENAKGVVILWHGVNDLNVDFKSASHWWEALKEVEDVTVKLNFHLGKHASPSNQAGFDFYSRIHGVLDDQLYGLSNTAIDDWPALTIQNNETLEYEEHDRWPLNDRVQKFYLTPDRVGNLSVNKPSTVTELGFTDVKALTLTRPAVTAARAPQMAAAQYTTWKHNIIGGSDTPLSSDAPFNIKANADRLIYTVDIKEDTRISGYINMTAKVASDKRVGAISAMLVDLGNAQYVHRTYASAGTMGTARTVGSVINFPAGSSDSGSWNASTTNLTSQDKNTAVDPWNIITRGSASVQKPNYSGKTWIDYPETNFVPEYFYRNEFINPGTYYPYTWELSVTDYTIKAGHKLGLILYGTDPEYTQRPLTDPTNLTVEIGPDTYLSLPIVGAFATDEIQDAPPTITTIVLQSGTVGAAYSQTLAGTSDAPITWTLDADALPDGLTLSAEGVISGIPTASGAFNFTVKAENSAGSDTKTLSITIDPAVSGGVILPPGITPAPGQSAVDNGNGTYTLPAGGTVETPGGVVTNVPSGTVVNDDGTVTLPPGAVGSGTVTISGSAGYTTVAVPGSTTIKSDGTVTMPGGETSVMTTPDGTTAEISGGSLIRPDGTIVVGPDGGIATYSDNTTKAIAAAAELTVNPDGSLKIVERSNSPSTTSSGGGGCDAGAGLGLMLLLLGAALPKRR